MNDVHDENVTIERAKSEDAEAAADLLRQTWLATYPNEDVGITKEDIRLRTEGENGERLQQNIDKWRKSIESTDGKSATYVARKDGKVIGLTFPVITPEGQHRIGTLYVLPEAQDQGVGGKLMQANLAWHGETKPVYLAVAAYNQKAINFYKKYGFVETSKKVEDLSARRRGLKELPEIEMMRQAASQEVGDK